MLEHLLRRPPERGVGLHRQPSLAAAVSLERGHQQRGALARHRNVRTPAVFLARLTLYQSFLFQPVERQEVVAEGVVGDSTEMR